MRRHKHSADWPSIPSEHRNVRDNLTLRRHLLVCVKCLAGVLWVRMHLRRMPPTDPRMP